MKRFLCIALAAALGARLSAAFAQDALEPDERTVLEKARQEYAQSDTSEDIPEEPTPPDAAEAPAGPEASETRTARPHSPVVLSFVPGLQTPSGSYDTTLALGYIGSAVGAVDGFQGAGVFCIAERVDGFQGAGVFNMAEAVDGFQGAGVFNMAEAVDGFQGAGVFNIAEAVDGFQAAGVFNVAGTVSGGMLASVFNAADSVDGVMIGLVNVAEHLDGPAIGLVNIIGDGIHELGMQYVPDEDMTYLQYRTGTADLFALYYAGVGSEDWFEDADSLIVGLGFGHRLRMDKRGAGLDLEFCVEQELYPARRAALESASDAEDCSAFIDNLCPYPSLRVSLNVPFFGPFRIFAGLKTDFDVPSWGSYVPDRLRTSSLAGDGWSGEVFGLGFSAWPKLFFGVSL